MVPKSGCKAGSSGSGDIGKGYVLYRGRKRGAAGAPKQAARWLRPGMGLACGVGGAHWRFAAGGHALPVKARGMWEF